MAVSLPVGKEFIKPKTGLKWRRNAPVWGLAQATALLRRLVSCFSHARAWETIVSRFWNRGRHGNAA
jgi:hypothetical protein